MSFTFGELKTAIQSYTDNSEATFVANLSNFIKAAEQRIFSNVDLENFRKNATGVMTTGNQYLRTPTDFLAPFSLFITTSGSEGFLLEKDVNFMREAFPDVTSTGKPLYYGFFDSSVTSASGLVNANFILGPTPNADYTVELHYYYRPNSLTALAATEYTWLSENSPNSLLYGSLIEAYIFMKGEPDIIALYESRFAESLSRLKDLAEARENADAYREGLPERPRT